MERSNNSSSTKTVHVRFPADDSPELMKHILIPSLSDSSPEELSAIYTTERDHHRAMIDARDCILFARRQHHLQQTALASGEPFVVNRQEQEDATGYCLRGLESMQSKALLELSSLRKRLVRDVVLLEQKRSKEKSRTGNGRNDQCDQRRRRSCEERVAAASAEASSWARDRAYERAAADAAWVQQHVLLEETLAAALKASEAADGLSGGAMPPHQSSQGDAAAHKKRRRRSSVTYCPTTRLSSCSSSFGSSAGGGDGTDPKSLAQSFRRLSCKGGSAPSPAVGALPQVLTSPRTYAYRPTKTTKKTAVMTQANIASSPTA